MKKSRKKQQNAEQYCKQWHEDRFEKNQDKIKKHKDTDDQRKDDRHVRLTKEIPHTHDWCSWRKMEQTEQKKYSKT